MGDTDLFFFTQPSSHVLFPAVLQPKQPGGIWARSSTLVSHPGAKKLQFPFPEGCSTEVGSSAGVLARQLHLLFVAISLLLVFP